MPSRRIPKLVLGKSESRIITVTDVRGAISKDETEKNLWKKTAIFSTNVNWVSGHSRGKRYPRKSILTPNTVDPGVTWMHERTGGRRTHVALVFNSSAVQETFIHHLVTLLRELRQSFLPNQNSRATRK